MSKKSKVAVASVLVAVQTLERCAVLSRRISNDSRDLRSLSKNFKPLRRLLKCCADIQKMDSKAKRLSKKKA